jgi:AGCS family alanine or glycine:cation symporter
MFQTNQLASTFKESFGITPILTGVVVSTLVGFVIFGGIKRIGAVTTFMVPFMSGIYMLAIAWILVTHADRLPGVLATILHSAFHGWTAPAGGLAGFTVAQALIHGVRRACFSNEAGMGSAAIAHSAAITHEPIREGCVALLEPFLDTVVMCTAGALVVLMADTWHESSNGVVITAAAFNTFIPGFGTYFIPVAVFFFATASLLGWSYYGEQAFAYLTDGKSILIYKFAFLAFAVLGSVIENVLFIVNFADLAMGFMVIPNLISLVILLPLLRRRTDDYFHAMRHQQPAPALNRPAL